MNSRINFLGKTNLVRIIATLGCLACLAARAASDTWNGGGADNNWTTPGNWNGVTPVQNDELFFDGSTRTSPTNNYAAGTSFGAIVFNGTASSFGLGGNGIVLDSQLEDASGDYFGGCVSNLSPNPQILGLAISNSAGPHFIAAANGAGQMSFSAPFSRGTGATVQFVTNGLANINFTGTGLPLTNGIIGGWAILNTNWAAFDGSSNIIPFSAYTSVAGNATIVSNPASNVRINTQSTGNTLNAATTTDVNSLNWQPSSATGNQTIQIGAAQILRLGAQGGILNSFAANEALSIGNGVSGSTLTAGGTNNAPGELSLVQLGSASARILVNTKIANNGTGAVTVDELGSVDYYFANTYSGGTYLDYGEAYLQGGATFGSGPIYVFSGARADFGGNNAVTITNNLFIAGFGLVASGDHYPGAIKSTYEGTISGAVTLLSNASIDPNAGSQYTTFTGPISGTGSLSISGPDTGNVGGTAIVKGNCSYTGDTIIDASANNSVGADLEMGTSNNTLNMGGNLVLVGSTFSGIATFDLNGTTQSVNGLIAVNNAGSTVVKSSGVGGLLVVGGNNTNSYFGGNVENGGGTVALTKVGTGTLTLAGNNNTYSGGTIISNGVLALSGSMPDTAQIAVFNPAVFDVSQTSFTLQSGQTLAGNSGINGSVNTASGATISPGYGAAAGTLTFTNNLTLNSGEVNFFKLSATTNGANDHVVVGGVLTLNGATVQISASALQTGRYKLFTYGTESGSAAANLVLNYTPVGNLVATLDDSITNEIDLVVTNGLLNLTWKGDNTANNWDTTSSNWLKGATPALFTNGSAVTFNDSGSKSPAVNLTGTEQPVSLLVSNSTGAYTFAGGGSLGGSTRLTKQGAGTLALTESGGDSFVGGIGASGGTLILSNSNVNIAGGIAIANAALTLAFNGTIAGGLSVSNGTAAFYNGGTLNGNLSVSNNGSVLLDQNNSPSGNTIITTGGTVQVGTNDTDGQLPSGSILLNGTLLFARTDNVTLYNSIAGGGTLIEEGGGILTLGADDSSWTGSAQVEAGTLQMGVANALGAGTNLQINVSSGATLDVNGIQAALAVTAAGTGVGGEGAVVNNAGSVYPVINYLTLAGNTAIGGTGRWDLRAAGGTFGNPALTKLICAGGQPFNLAKVGANFIGLVAATVDTNLANIDVQGGTLDIEGNTTGLGNPTNTLTVENGATLFLYQPTNLLNKVFVVNDGGWIENNSGTNVIIGPVVLNTNAAGGPGNCQFNVDAPLSISNAISGPGELDLVNGNQTLFLSSSNTYTGSTLINDGTLALVGNGSISTSSNLTIAASAMLSVTGRGNGTLTLVPGQALGGNGTVQGNLVVGPGATVSPGISSSNLVGTLMVSSNITLSGTTFIKLDEQNGVNDLLSATGASANITFGGTLMLTNLNGTLSANQLFTIFSAAGYSGSFSSIVPASPGPGLAWDTSLLSSIGSIRVVTATTTPVIGSIRFSGGNIILSGTNNTGPGGSYSVLSSTNVALALTNWTVLTNGTFDGNGNFSFTNAVGQGGQRYFILQEP